jgi:hypothetical protein
MCPLNTNFISNLSRHFLALVPRIQSNMKARRSQTQTTKCRLYCFRGTATDHRHSSFKAGGTLFAGNCIRAYVTARMLGCSKKRTSSLPDYRPRRGVCQYDFPKFSRKIPERISEFALTRPNILV